MTKRRYTLEEQKANRIKWAEALESGEYEQCQRVLRDGYGYCCLGVLCVLSGAWLYDIKGRKKAVAVAPRVAMDFVGLTSDVGFFNDSAYPVSSLAKLNDDGASFTDIAKLIRAEPEGLFKGGGW